VVGREPVEPVHDTALFKRICDLSHLDGTMFRQK